MQESYNLYCGLQYSMLTCLLILQEISKIIMSTLITDQVVLVASVRPLKRQFVNGSDDGILCLRLLDYCTSPIF